MKNLCLVAFAALVLVACGKKDEPVVTTSNAVTPQTCQAGYIWNGSTCVVGQPGQVYPGQPGQPGYPGQPGTQPYYPSYPQMCGGGYGGYPQYPGQYPYCGSSWSSYRFYSYNGYIFWVRY